MCLGILGRASDIQKYVTNRNRPSIAYTAYRGMSEGKMSHSRENDHFLFELASTTPKIGRIPEFKRGINVATSQSGEVTQRLGT